MSGFLTRGPWEALGGAGNLQGVKQVVGEKRHHAARGASCGAQTETTRCSRAGTCGFLTSLFALNLLNFADASLTHVATSMGATELNPLVAWAMVALPGWWFAIKVGIVAALSLVFFALREETPAVGRVVNFLTLFYGVVVAWDVAVLTFMCFGG